MECPAEIAESFLRQWQDESTVLAIGLSTPRFIFTGDGRVVSFDISEAVHLSMLADTPSGQIVDTSSDLVVSFKGVSFEYGDSREMSIEVREEAEAKYETILSVIEGKPEDKTPPKFILVLSKLNNQPDIRDSQN